MASFNTIISAAEDILSIVANVDTVGIYDNESLQQVFANARPVHATVRETSRVMDHPLETGTIISDHRIINQIEIDVSVIISASFYASAYQQIKSAFLNATLLAVQTRTGFYPNMILADMPHEESPEMYDSITMGLHFKEIIFVLPSSVTNPDDFYDPDNPNSEDYDPDDADYTDTVQSGNQVCTAYNPTGSSATNINQSLR